MADATDLKLKFYGLLGLSHCFKSQVFLQVNRTWICALAALTLGWGRKAATLAQILAQSKLARPRQTKNVKVFATKRFDAATASTYEYSYRRFVKGLSVSLDLWSCQAQLRQ